MPHAPASFQAGDPVRVRVHATERVHTDDGFGRLQNVNLGGATALFVRVTDPDSGVSLDLAAATIDDAPGGIFGADAAPDQIATVGTWKAQGRFSLSGASRHTRVGTFEAEANLPSLP